MATQEFYVLNQGLNRSVKKRDRLFLFGLGKFMASGLKGRTKLSNLFKQYRELWVKPNEFAFRVCINGFDDSHQVIYKELFVEKVYPLEKINFKPDIIIDCGAHIGLYSLLKNILMKENNERCEFCRIK